MQLRYFAITANRNTRKFRLLGRRIEPRATESALFLRLCCRANASSNGQQLDQELQATDQPQSGLVAPPGE